MLKEKAFLCPSETEVFQFKDYKSISEIYISVQPKISLSYISSRINVIRVRFKDFREETINAENFLHEKETKINLASKK